MAFMLTLMTHAALLSLLPYHAASLRLLTQLVGNEIRLLSHAQVSLSHLHLLRLSLLSPHLPKRNPHLNVMSSPPTIADAFKLSTYKETRPPPLHKHHAA
jgi:hypothetical protein